PTLFPYTTLFRSWLLIIGPGHCRAAQRKPYGQIRARIADAADLKYAIISGFVSVADFGDAHFCDWGGEVIEADGVCTANRYRVEKCQRRRLVMEEKTAVVIVPGREVRDRIVAFAIRERVPVFAGGAAIVHSDVRERVAISINHLPAHREGRGTANGDYQMAAGDTAFHVRHFAADDIISVRGE